MRRCSVLGMAGLLAVTGLVLAGMFGCGGGKEGTAVALLSSGGNAAQAPPDIIPRYVITTEINRAPAPAGVDSGLWDELTGELVRVLEQRQSSQIAQHPPEGDYNRIDDLHLVDDAGAMSLAWTYVNVGDYDQDGLVGISDLTPIGLYFNVEYGAADWDDAQLADGNNDGTVNIADITPIGNNFQAYVTGYNIYGGYLVDGLWELIDSVEFASGVSASPLSFSCELMDDGYPTYRVAPLDGTDAEGVGGTLDEGIFSPLIEPLGVTPEGVLLDTPTDLVFTISLHPLISQTALAELFTVDAAGAPLDQVGQLLDDGLEASGDELELDGISSIRLQVNAAVEETQEYRAQITYDGDEGQRTVLSNIVKVLFFEEISTERRQEIGDQLDAIFEELELLAGSMTRQEAAAQLAAQLADDPTLAASGVTGSGMGVWWHTPEGIACYASLIPVETPAEAGSTVSTAIQPGDASEFPAELKSPSSPGNSRVIGNHRVFFWDNHELNSNFPMDLTAADDKELLVHQLASHPRPRFYVKSAKDNGGLYNPDPASAYSSPNYLISELSDSGVTIVYAAAEAIGKLGDPTKTELLMALPTEYKDHAPPEWYQIGEKDGRYAHGRFGGNSRIWMGFTPKEIETRFSWLGQERSLIYLAIGGSMSDTTLAEVFCKKTKSVVVGYSDWSERAEGDPLHRWGNILFSKLLEGMTAGEALAATRELLHQFPEDYFRIYGNTEIVIADSEYRIVDLGIPYDFTQYESYISAQGMNTKGDVVGWCDVWEEQSISAFVWTDNDMKILDTSNEKWAMAYAINDCREIVGEYESDYGPRRACCWLPVPDSGKPLEFKFYDLDPATDNQYASSQAIGISTLGKIAGTAAFETGILWQDRPACFRHPCDGSPEITEIGRSSADPYENFRGRAITIGYINKVYGITSSYPDRQPDGGSRCFASLPASEPEYLYYYPIGTSDAVYYWDIRAVNVSTAVGANVLFQDLPEPAGQIYTFGSLYNLKTKTMQSLLTSDEFLSLYQRWNEPHWEGLDVQVVGTAVNWHNAVVGHFGGLPGGDLYDRAFICTPDTPPMWLDELIPAGSGWELKSAVGVSDDKYARYICGTGLHNGKQRAYLMIRRSAE